MARTVASLLRSDKLAIKASRISTLTELSESGRFRITSATLCLRSSLITGSMTAVLRRRRGKNTSDLGERD